MKLALLLITLAACGGAQSTTTGSAASPHAAECPPIEPDGPSGTWVDEETRAYLVVAMVGGVIVTLFTIDDDGEVWPVSDAAWDGATLTFTTYVPSTGYTLRRTLSLAEDGTLVGSHEGSHTGSGDVWKRYSAPAP